MFARSGMYVMISTVIKIHVGTVVGVFIYARLTKKKFAKEERKLHMSAMDVL